MDARAVVALAVVLGDQLPVGADLVHDLLGRPERGEVEAGHVVDEVAELRLEPRGHGLGGEAQEHEALPGLAPDGREAVGVEAEVVEVLGVLGAHQAAVELVDPGVVGALEADGLAALALLDRGAPVAAHVVERADLAVPAADQEHALAQHVAHAGSCRVRGPPPRGRPRASHAAGCARAPSRGPPGPGRSAQAGGRPLGTRGGRTRARRRSGSPCGHCPLPDGHRQGHGPVGGSSGAPMHRSGTLAAHDRRRVPDPKHAPDRRPRAGQPDPAAGRARVPRVQHRRVRVVGGDPPVRVRGDRTGVRRPRRARAAAAGGGRGAVRRHARRPLPAGARPPRRLLAVRDLDRADRRRDAARVGAAGGLPRRDRRVDDADPRAARAQRAPPGPRPRSVRADRGQRRHEHRGVERAAARAAVRGGDPVRGGAGRRARPPRAGGHDRGRPRAGAAPPCPRRGAAPLGRGVRRGAAHRRGGPPGGARSRDPRRVPGPRRASRRPADRRHPLVARCC